MPFFLNWNLSFYKTIFSMFHTKYGLKTMCSVLVMVLDTSQRLNPGPSTMHDHNQNPYKQGNNMDLTLEGPCIIFCNIYTCQRDTQCNCTDCLLILRCQLYMFRTVTVHPQELLFRYCMCRLWYVLIRPAGTTFEKVLPQTLYQRDVSDSAVLTKYHSLHIQHLKSSSWGWTVTVRNM